MCHIGLGKLPMRFNRSWWEVTQQGEEGSGASEWVEGGKAAAERNCGRLAVGTRQPGAIFVEPRLRRQLFEILESLLSLEPTKDEKPMDPECPYRKSQQKCDHVKAVKSDAEKEGPSVTFASSKSQRT